MESLVTPCGKLSDSPMPNHQRSRRTRVTVIGLKQESVNANDTSHNHCVQSCRTLDGAGDGDGRSLGQECALPHLSTPIFWSIMANGAERRLDLASRLLSFAT